MGPDDFITVLSAMLLDSKVIFISDSLPMLSSVTLGMQLLLSPLKWCHTFIPIVPKHLMNMVWSPTPYIVGIKRGIEIGAMEEGEWEEATNEVIIVQIDQGKGVTIT